MSAATEWKGLRWRLLSCITCRHTETQFKTQVASEMWNCWRIIYSILLTCWGDFAFYIFWHFVKSICAVQFLLFDPFWDFTFLGSFCLTKLAVSPPTQLFFFFFLSSASLPRLPMLEWLAALLMLDILSDECCRLIRRSGNDRQNLP